ncbi:hypothetical protein CRG98_004349 [Punica granatum]|uniref:Reverse transcriptase Ty1/copia-type domain-containing protein n=1 Tax=Punica granatum TaxID=22663 RepID=A0A2I0L3M3_PUNGR|nr:hypothetical protein CRG98_004349 [Punica granatum]
MTLLLATYGFLDHVEGRAIAPNKTITAADGTIAANPDYLRWESRDNFTLTCVMLAVTEEIGVTILTAKTSQEAWTSLATSFLTQTAAQEDLLDQQWRDLKKGNQSMAKFIGTIGGEVGQRRLGQAGQPNSSQNYPGQFNSGSIRDPCFGPGSFGSQGHVSLSRWMTVGSLLVLHLLLIHDQSTESGVSAEVTEGNDVAPVTQNTHRMTTRSKDGTLPPPRFTISRHPSAFSVSAALQEPQTFAQARKHSTWRAAMEEEYLALLQNHTWDLVPPSPAQNVVGCKWVYRIKQKADGTIDHYKARLVAKGFNQREGVDYSETFSLVIKLVYMSQPPGFLDASRPNYVCRLRRSLYGLKQAPRAWFQHLNTYLQRLGFSDSKLDPSLFILRGPTYLVYLLVYVDDIILTGTPVNQVCQFMHCPTTVHWMVVKRILRYLKGTITYGLHIRPGSISSIHGFSDADWAGNPDDHCSVSGFIVFLGSNPISWSSKKHRTVALSSTESEYKSLANATAEILWL